MDLFSPAAQVIISIIPIVGITFSAIIIFFALLWHHHEVKMLISKGLYNPPKFNLRIFSLMSGLCLVGVGLVLTVVLFIVNKMSLSVLGGLIPFVLGIMLLVFYNLIHEEK